MTSEAWPWRRWRRGAPQTGVVAAAEVDREAWDAFVLRRAAGNLMQTWGWSELKRRYGWTPIRLLRRDGAGEIAGTMSLLLRRLAPGVTLAYAPRGPAVADLAADVEVAAALVEEARHRTRRHAAVALKLDPEWRIDAPATAAAVRAAHLRDSAFEIQHRITYLVSLEGGADAVLARIKSSTRRNIRLAERAGVGVERLEGAEGVRRYYPLHCATAERKGFLDRVRPVEYYIALAEELGRSCPVSVLIASVDGGDVSGMIAAAAGPRLCFLFGGNLVENAGHHASYLLHWRAIEWGVEQGCELYDMWGVPSHEDPRAPGAGYYEFKTRWNGEVARHLRCQDAGLWPPAAPVLARLEAAVMARRPLPD